MKGSYIDLLIRIKNGYMASKDSVMTPYSKIKEDILKILKKLGYIEDFVVDKKNKLEQILGKGRIKENFNLSPYLTLRTSTTAQYYFEAERNKNKSRTWRAYG